MILLDTQYRTENMNLQLQCTVNHMEETPHKKDSIEIENKLEIESCNVFVQKQTMKITWIVTSGKEFFYKNDKICFKKEIFKVSHKKLLSSTSGERNKIRLHPTAMRTEKSLPWFNSSNNNNV